MEYILVRLRDQQNVLMTREVPIADEWTDRRLVISKMKIRLYPRRRPQAFDMVNRTGLWKVMQNFGCAERLAHMVCRLHGGMMACVPDDGMVSEAFAVTNGVKQRCVLVPNLFSHMFSVILIRMQVPKHVSMTTVHDLLFAGDCALNTTTEADMQRSMELFAAGCANFGLKMNTDKTVFMHQLPPGADYNAPRINVNGAELSTLSRNSRIDDDVARQISKASQSFDRLQVSVWNRHVLQLPRKLKAYKAVVPTTLLCR
ncbi:unnamed protein product, partial [Dibothriocephalus latus]